MVINYVYDNRMIGEIKLTCGSEAADRRSNDFLKSLAKSTGTIYEFKQHLLTEFGQTKRRRLNLCTRFQAGEIR